MVNTSQLRHDPQLYHNIKKFKQVTLYYNSYNIGVKEAAKVVIIDFRITLHPIKTMYILLDKLLVDFGQGQPHRSLLKQPKY